MWRIFVIATLAALAACSTGRAVKVRCDRHLVPINARATDHHAARNTSPGGDTR
jgi:hypothetical protein